MNTGAAGIRNPSEKIDEAFIAGVYLTLAKWHPFEEYPPSYEIGWRHRGGFELIQWSGLSKEKAWDITKHCAGVATCTARRAF